MPGMIKSHQGTHTHANVCAHARTHSGRRARTHTRTLTEGTRGTGALTFATGRRHTGRSLTELHNKSTHAHKLLKNEVTATLTVFCL